jgi:hypothetical protein
MKKTVIAIFASFALVLGIGGLGESAQAVYPNTVATTTQILRSASVTEGRSFHVTVQVSAGNATISSGRVLVRFDGKSYSKSVSNSRATFTIRAPKVSRTQRLKMSAKYYRATGSIFQSSPTTSRYILVKNS